MTCVNCDKFSANDLTLFIESLEQINRMEAVKKQRQQRNRARYLADTLRYLDQQYPASSSSTLSSTDIPEDESVMESFEEKQIGYYYSTCVVPQNQYEVMNHQNPINIDENDSISCHTIIYSLPFDCMASIKLEEYDYETLDLKSKEQEKSHHYEVPYQTTKSKVNEENHHYEVPNQMTKIDKPKSKISILNVLRKKYKKCFSKKSNNCHKSESWTRLTTV